MLMELMQPFSARLEPLPVPWPRPLDLGAQRLQSLAGYITVIGAAQDILHPFHGGIEFRPERRRITGREHLHGIAETFAEDAHPVQAAVVAQILPGCLSEVAQQRG